jgi:hypothetical protein
MVVMISATNPKGALTHLGRKICHTRDVTLFNMNEIATCHMRYVTLYNMNEIAICHMRYVTLFPQNGLWRLGIRGV